MSKGRIQELVESMDPLEAAKEMADAAKKLFSLLGEEALRDFLTRSDRKRGPGQDYRPRPLMTGYMHGRRCRSNSDVSEFGGKNQSVRATAFSDGPGDPYSVRGLAGRTGKRGGER